MLQQQQQHRQWLRLLRELRSREHVACNMKISDWLVVEGQMDLEVAGYREEEDGPPAPEEYGL